MYILMHLNVLHCLTLSTDALASTAFLPLFAALSSIFGRRPLLVAAILFFAAGSAMCGAAQSQSVIFAGRTIQGVTIVIVCIVLLLMVTI